MPKYQLNRRRGKLTDMMRRESAKKLTTQIATRDNLNPWLTAYDALPNPDPVLRKTGLQFEVINELKREAHVSACSKSRKSGVKKRLWKIDQKKASSAAVETIDAIFKDLTSDSITETGLRPIINQLLDGWGYGYKPAEVLWERQGNLYIPYAVIGKPPEWFEFGNDNELRLKHLTGKSEPVPDKKFLLARYEAEYNNPYGEAQYTLAFWPVTFKKGGIKFWAQFLESWGMPHAIGKYPRNVDKADKDRLLDALKLLIQNAAAVIPDDATVELLELKAGNGSSDLYERHAHYHDSQISKCILGHGGAADSTPGRLGGDDPAMNVRSDIIEDDSSMIEGCFNTLIRYIHELNPSLGSERPEFVLYDENDVDSARADRDFKLMNSNRVILKQKYFLRCYDFREDEIEVDESMHQQPDVSPDKPPPPDKPEFSASPSGQDNVDELIDAINDETLQQQAEILLKPIIDIVNSSKSFDDVRNGIIATFPNLDDSGITQTLEKAMLLAHLQGSQPDEVTK